MKLIVGIKNRIEEYYLKYTALTGYLVRLVLSFIILLVLRGNIGFSPVLSNIFFVIGLSLAGALLPPKALILVLAAYCVIQVFSLSAGVGLFICILFTFMYLVYFRFNEDRGYVLLLIPVLCMIRLPLLCPLVLAVMGPTSSVLSVMMGIVSYYSVRFIYANAAVLQGVADTNEIGKISMILSGIFNYREMWYTLFCAFIAFFVVYYLKKININRSNEMAIAVGSGIYLISMLLFSLILQDLTSQNLIWLVLGTVISCIAALVVTYFSVPLDYKRTELLEFEDEEYKYYVRAVPKSSISKESVRIKRIYSRRQAASEKGREEDK